MKARVIERARVIGGARPTHDPRFVHERARRIQ